MSRYLLDLRKRLAVILFPKFGYDWQELCTQLAGETALKVEAQDRARDLEAQLRKVNEELAESRKETTHAVMLVADWFGQQMFGRKIFVTAPDLPEHKLTPEMFLKRRQQGRAVAEEMERQFFEALGKEPEAPAA